MGKCGPTEAVLDATRDLDRWRVEEILAAIHREDRNAMAAVGRVLPEVASATDVLVHVLGGGGRWFNVGAGTSGRMGALDAAEIPPTFGLPAHEIGERIVRSVEQFVGDARWTDDLSIAVIRRAG